MWLRRSRSLTPRQAAEALDQGHLQVVDVREPREVTEAAVDGTILIPLSQLATRLGELDDQRPVAFLCRSGTRSAAATRMATKAGLDAANIRGGIVGWTRAGLPVAATPRGRGGRAGT